MRKIAVLMTTTALALGLAGAPSIADADHEVTVSQVGAAECFLTTFEGGSNFAEIHPDNDFFITDGPTDEVSDMRFPGWRTMTSGPNNPSGTTVALMVAGTQTVTFDTPVARVSLFYASSPTVTLKAFDAEGNLVGSASAPGNFSGGFNQWDPLNVDAGDNLISSVTLFGGAFFTAIDDFQACSLTAIGDFEAYSLTAIEVPIEIRPEVCPNLNTESHDVFTIAILGTPDLDQPTIDPTTIDPASIRLGNLNARGVVAPIRAAIEDVATSFNGLMATGDCSDCTTEDPDGLVDLTLTFGTEEVVAALGLVTDEECRALLLTGETRDGTAFFGSDVVLIRRK